MSVWEDVLTHAFVISVATSAIKIAVIAVVSIVILRLSGTVVDRLFLRGQDAKKYFFEEKRAKTLSALLKSVLRYLVYFIAGIMILKEFNIDTTSILAGAGIVGLAVGFGAQSLVRDIITGFFIIFEDQFSVGDYVTAAELSGTVEEIGLRVIKLRDFNGVLHIIPNGSTSKVTNFTRGTMLAAVNIPIAYEADKEKAWQAVEEAMAEVRQEMDEIIDGPRILGFVDFNQYSTVLRVIAKVVPLEQAKVETALRQRIIRKFAAENIAFITKIKPTDW